MNMMMNGTDHMMGPYPMQTGPFATQNLIYPQGGYVTLDPDYYPGQVTLDPGNPYFSYTGTESMHHPHHYQHHPHHCPQPCPPSAPEPITYVVRQGDSVYKIAQRFGTTMQAIILANNLRNPDLIYPGQVFYIPVV